ncbi:MAG TPA: PTS system mannose/fructose/sorbose family transporter subunit IID [Thermodesulfobacteriota bacterium]|nr:PTS system mannose/fructose/sorbose family transporter subunit IID [Thermodesulfobacteriota bacterium]
MVSRTARLKVLLGSFFIQSSWSYEKMQGLGFAAALKPALDEVWGGDDASRGTAIKRHLDYFNAHPYMASPILGATVKLEERAKSGERGANAPVRFKSLVTAPYSAMGDMFFWGSVRPLASVAGVLAAVFWGLWGPVVFLLVYNLFHLWMRLVGFNRGYELGEGVVEYIKRLALPQWSVRVKQFATLVLGSGAVAVAWRISAPLSDGGDGFSAALPLLVASAAIAGVFSINVFLKKGLRISRLLYMVVVPLILYGVVVY